MKFALTTAAAAGLMASTALAGGYTPPVVEPVEVAVAPVATMDTDWTGIYAGLQYGIGSAKVKVDGDTAFDEDLKAYGAHLGYNHDFGQYVLGGELDYNKIDVDNLDDKGDMTRLRLRAGYDMGRFMPYATLGIAHLSIDTPDAKVSENAPSFGIGADFLATDRFTVGADYSYQKWKDVADTDGVNIDSGIFQLRASYRF